MAHINFSTGDLTQRLCTAAELRVFFSSFGARGPTSAITYTYIKPNRNCNLTSWVSGCEPGWSCSVGKDKIDLKTTNIPSRIEDCQSCCEGFFCPHGLTCMIRKYVIKLPLVIFLPSLFCTRWNHLFTRLLSPQFFTTSLLIVNRITRNHKV